MATSPEDSEKFLTPARPQFSEPEFVPDGVLTKPLEAEAFPENFIEPFYLAGNSAKHRVAQWIHMRMLEPGISTAEVARRLGVSPSSLNSQISKGRREGWLRIEDPMLKIEHELIPKIVKNLNVFLDQGDRTVTVEAAKGVLFPSYRDAKGIVENKVAILGLNIQLPETKDLPTDQRRGNIFGAPKPAALEAEIISGESE